MLNNIKAAIIDLDGTMLDTAPDFHVAVNRMRADLGLAPLALHVIVDFVGKGSENLMRRVLAVDYDDTDIEQHFAAALSSYQEHYAEINGKYATLYPQVIEGLQVLQKKGLRLACVTNKPVAFALPLLEQKGLRPYFEIVYGGDSLQRKKPDPLPLLQVCQDFSLEPSQVVAIGDSSNDALAARAAGCRVLNVPYGYNHGEPIHNVDSDGIVQTLLDAANQIS
ncbi:phosphoglycolate phosphatase [Herbaspirillum sp. Sphag1AN]|uniref:phosphoglycolate phosphatase n=1 Tax=unclassified Herbaspirillum TaxID=2624150 RepID=UPI00161FC627|nr:MULTISPECIES: phosphoglycolate phosphatase [unclassified Herbaspirillum]MBB3212801.1 phosphoglycolate phosphatase [Herbaspirillum sp. Sphag1AN]MBB3245998.1 phosphoglycolate phosphatase [Herbaspirillum sp. Sphag64]